MRLLALLLLFSPLFSEIYTDPFSEMTIDIPDGYRLNEDGCIRNPTYSWVEFSNEKGAIFALETEVYPEVKSIFEHFYHSLTTDDLNYESEKVVCDQLDFKSIKIGERDITRTQLRLLTVDDCLLLPMFLFDYLFVHKQFGFCISIIQNDDGTMSKNEIDAQVQKAIQTIVFPKA